MSSDTVTCPADFVYVLGECFQVTSAITWPAAVVTCEQQSAYLTVPRSEAEWRWVQQVFTALGQIAVGGDVWMGLSDISEEGVWQRADRDELLAYTPWIAGQPNNFDFGLGSVENCAAASLEHEGLWYDFPCYRALRGLCRHNATVTPMHEGTTIYRAVLLN